MSHCNSTITTHVNQGFLGWTWTLGWYPGKGDESLVTRCPDTWPGLRPILSSKSRKCRMVSSFCWRSKDRFVRTPRVGQTTQLPVGSKVWLYCSCIWFQTTSALDDRPPLVSRRNRVCGGESSAGPVLRGPPLWLPLGDRYVDPSLLVILSEFCRTDSHDKTAGRPYNKGRR